MKGLLLKDWYMLTKYCRSFLLIVVVFIAASLFGEENLFFVFYPCMLCGVMPVTLLGYDERSRWIEYSASLPYTKAQIVSAKYLIGLFAQAGVLLLSGAAQGIKMSVSGSFSWNDFLVLMLLLVTIAAFTSSISLPFIFKYGVEKGRIAYYVMIGFVCGASVLASRLFGTGLQAEIQPNSFLIVFAFASIGVYALSWYLSIVFYKKRELQ